MVQIKNNMLLPLPYQVTYAKSLSKMYSCVTLSLKDDWMFYSRCKIIKYHGVCCARKDGKENFNNRALCIRCKLDGRF